MPRSRKAPRSLWFLLPTLNEEQGLPKTVAAVRRSFPRAPILVVDGRSTDRTQALAKKLRCQLLIQKGKGKGNAMIEAFQRIPASATIALIDADGSYDPADVPALLERFSGKELVLGNRFSAPEKGSFTATNNVGNRLLNLAASALFAHRLRDTLTGLRVFRCSTVRSLNLTAQNFEIETEMTLKALKQRIPVLEVPCRYTTREGETKLHPFSDGARILRRILKERLS